MPRPELLIEVSGEVDFDSRNPILVEESGRRWRLENAGNLFIGDEVTVAGTKKDICTLYVHAIIEERWGGAIRAGKHV